MCKLQFVYTSYAPPPTRSGSAAAPGWHPGDAPGLVAAARRRNDATAIDHIDVVRCKDCEHCYDLSAKDPMEPYSGAGDGSFYCAEFDMDFYAPRYSAATYYCADGKRRTHGSEATGKE